MMSSRSFGEKYGKMKLINFFTKMDFKKTENKFYICIENKPNTFIECIPEANVFLNPM